MGIALWSSVGAAAAVPSWSPGDVGTYYEWQMVPSGQVLPGFGAASDGELGTTSGADTSDPTAVTEGLSFDGGDRVRTNTTIPAGGGRTVLVAMQAAQTAAAKYILGLLGSPFYPSLLQNAGAPSTMRWQGTSTSSSTTSPTALHDATAWHTYAVSWDGATAQWYADGAAAGAAQAYAATVAAWTNIDIGSSGGLAPFVGKIAWVLIFPTAEAADVVAQAHNYIRGNVASRGVVLAAA